MTRQSTPSPASSRASVTRAWVTRVLVIPNPASLSSSPRRPPRAHAAATAAAAAAAAAAHARASPRWRDGARHRVSLRALVTRARFTRMHVIPNPRFPLVVSPRHLPPRARAAAAAAWRPRRGGGGTHASARVIFHVIAHVRDARVCHSRARHPEPRFPLLSSPRCPPRARAAAAAAAAAAAVAAAAAHARASPRWRDGARHRASLRAPVLRACVTHTHVIPNPRFPLVVSRCRPRRARAAAAAAARRRRRGGGGAAAAARRVRVASMTRQSTPSPASSRASLTRAWVTRVLVIPNPTSLSSSPRRPPRARAAATAAAAAAASHARARVASMTRWRASSRVIARVCNMRACHSHARHPEPPLFLSSSPPPSPTARARGGGGGGGVAAAAWRRRHARVGARNLPRHRARS